MVSGICVFDVDGTLKSRQCSSPACHDEVREVVSRCRALNMGLAINTARIRMSGGLKRYLHSLGIDVDTLPAGAVQVRAYTSNKKLKALDKIAAAYGNVPKSKVFFFDDRRKNIAKALEAGYRGIHVTGKYVTRNIL
jgi:hypothetical protein